MPIELQLAAPRKATTHQGLQVEVRIRNTGSAAVEIPSLYDAAAALTFELFSPSARKLRQMDETTSQAMLLAARPSLAATLEELPAGDTWSRTIDLSPYHYLLPEGDLRLRARYEYEPAQIRAFSDLLRVQVQCPPLQGVQLRSESCMLNSLLAVLHAAPGAESEWYLRHYNSWSPLASWYSEPILTGESAQSVVAVTATFTHAESFDPAFDRWILWTAGVQVKARLHRNGRPLGALRRGDVPNGWRLLPWSNVDRAGSLLLFFEAAPGRLECCRLETESLRPIFGFDFRGKLASVSADESSVHLLLEDRGLVHERVAFTGEKLESRRLFRSRLSLHACEFEPIGGSVKALFREGPHGGALEMWSASLQTGATVHESIDRLPLRHAITELAFDFDKGGRFHLLAATAEGRLYYVGPNLGPILVACGEGPFLPRVVTQRRVFLGFYDPATGYRFCRFSRRARPRLMSFEERA